MQEGAFIRQMINFIVWNARGANSAVFRRNFEALVNMHRPTMLVLLETKMVEHKNITKALKYDNYIQTTADGLS